MALRDQLEARLDGVDPRDLGDDRERIAYWLNAYNAALLRELSGRRPRRNLLLERRLFSRPIHSAGGHTYSLDQIEHGLLRRNRRPPYALRPTLRDGDPRLDAAPGRVDPRIHFALNCGARSCPAVHVYTEDVDRELDAAARDYLAAETDLDESTGTLTLPGLTRFYRGDFGGPDGELEFALDHLPDQVAGPARGLGEGLRVRHSRYDWRMEAPSA
jgi:hypothetical protein